MITRLAFYDMDGTLIDTPMPDIGRITWREKKGEDYPHVGWWGRAESLDTNVFDIKPFPAVLHQLNNDKARPDTRTILLTNRTEKLRSAVMKVLQKNHIYLDEYNLKTSGLDKDDRIERYLDKFPNVKEISFYDDREKEIELITRLKDKIGDNIIINIYQATNGNLSLVESYNRVKTIINEVLIALDKEKIKVSIYNKI
jgi:hypothetical protein